MGEEVSVSGDNLYTYTKNPTLITRLVLTGAVVCFAWSLLVLAADIVQVYLFHHAPLSHATIVANESREAIGSDVMIILTIMTNILFLRWVYVTNFNCHGFGAVGMTYSPGWSVGWFFIPLLNFLVPVLVLREIRRVSTNPESWKNQPGGWLPIILWVLWIGGVVFSTISKIESNSIHSLLALQQAANTVLFTRWILTLAWGAMFFFVRDIAKRQHALVSETPIPSASVSIG